MPLLQNGARAMASRLKPAQPFGNLKVSSASMLSRTMVKACFSSFVTGPRAMVRVMSVVPPMYCPPESTSSSPSGFTGISVSGVAE